MMIDVDYSDQLRIKSDYLNDAAHRYASSLPSSSESSSTDMLPTIRPIIGSDPIYHYRNKMEFSFGKNALGDVILGLKKKGDFSSVVELNQCHLISKTAHPLFSLISDFFTSEGISVWNPITHIGVLRHMVFRQSFSQGEILLMFVVSEECTDVLQRLTAQLQEKIPELRHVYMGIQATPSDTAFTTDITCLTGDNGVLYEDIGHCRFHVSPLSFFQTNSMQAAVLYQTILHAASPTPHSLLLDLYCGTGSIGIYCASSCGSVIGIEENPSSVADAKENAKLNKCHSISFYEGRVKNILKFNRFTPDIVIVDPPRSGMVPKACRRMAELEAPTLVYVSCQPLTMFRDLAELVSVYGYRIEMIQPVDMFPHTPHIECVVRLTKSA